MKWLKRTGWVVLVLTLSSIIYFVVMPQNRYCNDPLTSSLRQIANNLIEAVPEGPQKESLRTFYANFLSRVDKNQVSEEEIKRVASITMNYSVLYPDSIPDPEYIYDRFERELSDLPPSPPKLHKEKREELARKLIEFRVFQDQLDSLYSPTVRKQIVITPEFEKKMDIMMDSSFIERIEDIRKRWSADTRVPDSLYPIHHDKISFRMDSLLKAMKALDPIPFDSLAVQARNPAESP